MKQLEKIERVLRTATQRVATIGLACLVALTLATIADVLMRWLFNSPIEGVHDMYSLAIAVVVGSFFPVALIERHHISIKFLGAALGNRATAWLNTFANFSLLIFLVLMSWQFVEYVVEVIETGETTWILQLPIAPWWAVTACIIILCIPIQLFVTINDMISPRQATGHGHVSEAESAE